MFLEKVHSPSVGPQQALHDCVKRGSVKILIFGFRNSLWLQLESIIENLPKLPLATTWTCSPIFCKHSKNTDPSKIHNQLVRGLTLHFHIDDKSACSFLLESLWDLSLGVTIKLPPYLRFRGRCRVIKNKQSGNTSIFPTLGLLSLPWVVCFSWLALEQEDMAAGDKPVPGLQAQPLFI